MHSTEAQPCGRVGNNRRSGCEWRLGRKAGWLADEGGGDSAPSRTSPRHKISGNDQGRQGESGRWWREEGSWYKMDLKVRGGLDWWRD